MSSFSCDFQTLILSTKTESTRRSSNFNFEWIKPLYENSLKHIAFFFLHFSRAKDVISHLY